MKSFWNRTNIFLTLAISALVVCSAVYYFLYNSHQRLNNDLGKLISKTAEDRSKVNELQRIEKNLNVTLGDESRLSSVFVSQDMIADFIQALEKLMKQNNLSGSVDTVSEDHSPELSPLKKEYLTMTLSANGSWSNIMRFEGMLEKILYKTVIDSVNLNYGSDSGKDSGAKVGAWKIVVALKAIVTKTDSSLPPPSI